MSKEMETEDEEEDLVSDENEEGVQAVTEDEEEGTASNENEEDQTLEMEETDKKQEIQ